MEFLQDNLTTTMFVLGLALLAVEILILGFSTFVLFFVGLGTLLTGVLFLTGILPETVPSALLSTAIISAIFAGALWQPLKNMQQKTDSTKAKSDLIGLQFELPADLMPGETCHYRYSGIEWQLKSSQSIDSGTKVLVTDVEVGVMHVKPID